MEEKKQLALLEELAEEMDDGEAELQPVRHCICLLVTCTVNSCILSHN